MMGDMMGGRSFKLSLLATTAWAGVILSWPLAAMATSINSLMIGDSSETGETYTVSGAESFDVVHVGENAGTTGTLIIGAGTSITSGITSTYAILGNQARTTGTALVSGAGAAWTDNSYGLVVGRDGHGTLTVTGGAQISVKSFYVGDGSGGTGTGIARLSGTGTALTAHDGAYLAYGSGSSASMTVDSGAAFETVAGGLYFYNGGTLTVDGAGSSVRVGTLHPGTPATWTDSDGWFYMGHGTATISGGAFMEADGLYVSGDSSGSAVMTATGTGTVVNAHLLIYVGGDGNGITGNGAMTVSAGAVASAAVIAIGSDSGQTGTLLLTGSGSRLYTQPSGTFLGNVYAGSNGNGTITVQDGASLGVSNELRIAYDTDSTGSLIIGAAPGQAAMAPGTVTAARGVVFGDGAGSLVFNHTSQGYEFASSIRGDGSIRNLAGVTSLTGDGHGFNGTMTVEGGRLAVNGDFSSAGITVSNGGTLGGTGTVGTLSVAAGGVHAPGNSVGTQTVTGNYTLAAGATLQTEISNTGQMDKVVVTGGTVSLNGANLAISGLSGGPGGRQYSQVIIDNQGSSAISGTFASVSNSLAFYDAQIRYDGGTGNDVVLALERNRTSYAEAGSTPNQRAVGGAVGGLSGGGAAQLQDAILSLTSNQVQSAYTQLSGNIYPTSRQLNLNLTQQSGQQVYNRLANARAGSATPGQAGLSLSAPQLAGFAQTSADQATLAPATLGLDSHTASGAAPRADNGAWTQVVGGVGQIKASAEAVKTTYDWQGMLGGYDTAITPDVTLGGFFGYIQGDNRQNSISSIVQTDTVMAGFYGEYRVDQWRLNAQLGYSRIGADSRRDLNFGGFSHTATADYTDQTLTFDGEVARTVGLGQDVWLEPYAGASVLQQFLGHFSESGADAANLERDSDRVLTGDTKLGLRLSTMVQADENVRIVPMAGLAWKHHVGSRANANTLHFLSGGSEFTVNGTPADRNTLALSLGGAITAGDHWQAFATYAPSISEHQTEHAFSLGARYEW